MTKIAVIIPTYNRPKYLERLLDYLHKYGSDFNIIVADSSSNENKKLNRQIVSAFPNLKIRYVDKYSKKIDPLYKYADVTAYVKEKYCVFCPDDDFIAPLGIKKSADFLEKNPDFTVAHGYYIDFWLEPRKKKEKRFFWGIRYTNQSIVFADPKVRLTEYLSKYFQTTIYGVHRTDFVKMIYKELIKSKIDPADRFLCGELLLEALTLVHGKMKCLDIFYMARQLDRVHPVSIDFSDKNKYDLDYANLKQRLAVNLSKKLNLTIEKSREIIDNAMALYTKKTYLVPLDRLYFLKNKVKYILNSLHVPDWIYEKIRLLHKKLFLSKQMNTFYVSLSDPSSKYYGDFDRIRSQAISYFEQIGK